MTEPDPVAEEIAFQLSKDNIKRGINVRTEPVRSPHDREIIFAYRDGTTDLSAIGATKTPKMNRVP